MKCIEDYNFNITYNFYENIIYVKPLNDIFDKATVNILDQNRNLIYSNNIDVIKGLDYWFRPDALFTDYEIIYVEILNDTGILSSETIKIKTKSGIIIKQPILNIANKVGLGDQMFLSPSIRKLSQIYGRKIIISSSRENYDWGNYLYSAYKEFLKNNPYINYFIFTQDLFDVDKYDIFDGYKTGIDHVWINNKKLISTHFNFLLDDKELYLDYIPDKYNPMDSLPERYVCINPYISGFERSWEKEKWQKLVDLLNDSGIYVVSIGKFNYYNLEIKLGIDLAGTDQNMSQTWHIIDKCDVFVTFDCSMYILSQTTNTHILQLGWSHDNNLHKPFKNDKYHYVLGDCDLACRSSIKYTFDEFGTIINHIQPLNCALNIDYICKPLPLKVFVYIEKIIKENYGTNTII